MFTFLHTADIHLDSPLRHLALYEGAPVDLIRGASRRALQGLVRQAVADDVDFVLLAGDLYDGSWRDYNTALFFIEQMGLLRRQGILVFLVSGNHDAASRMTKSLRLPENVIHFSSNKPQTEIIKGLDVAIHGQSYAERATTDNLALSYPDPVAGCFNIGLLHTSLSGRPGHQPYAPCSRQELINKGYDYWALGHVHQREVVCRDPWIVFPGNLQGRHIRETGPKGATMVRVENNSVVEVSDVALDVVRWELASVDCGEVRSQDDLERAVSREYTRLLDRADGRPVMVRLQLTGTSPFHAELVADSNYWRSTLQALAIDSGDIWLEKMVVQTRRDRNLDPTVLDGSPLAGLFLQDVPPDFDVLSSPELQTLHERLPAELRTQSLFFPRDKTAKEQLLAEVRDMVLARILNRAGQ